MLKLVQFLYLPVEAYVLYWFYVLNSDREFTRIEAANAIGRRSKNTVMRYNKNLSDLGLVQFKTVRSRGILGFKAECVTLTDVKCRQILREGIKRSNRITKVVVNKDEKYLPLAKLLYVSHRKYAPKFLKGKDVRDTLLKWTKHMRLLVEKDGRTVSEIKAVILWCQQPDNFWFANILSGSKLREKFETLYSQYLQKSGALKKSNGFKNIKGKQFKGVDVKGLLNEL